MRILLIGQCTLQIGRIEFGNIGNYYIIEPLVRELHRCFPACELRTTFQMSDAFCTRENVVRLPMELYYGWTDADTSNTLLEVGIAETYRRTGRLVHTTPYISEVMAADLVIDFSGDMWGDNADFLGNNRFLVGLYKDYVAQRLGKTVVMLAGSPGPFADAGSLDLAREVFAGFTLVTNREPLSRAVLEQAGFPTDKVVDLSCPAFLFAPATGPRVEELIRREGLDRGEKPLVGFVLCGWNFSKGPFDRWPREDRDYLPFAEAVEHLTRDLGARVCLLSHSNGFRLPAPPFDLVHGRDYPIIKQLQSILKVRGVAGDVFTLDGIYSPKDTKAMIRRFSMLVSGRVHAAVAGLSECVPTVIIDYGHEPKAHKLRGFASVAGVEKLVADPSRPEDLINKIDHCFTRRDEIRAELSSRIPNVKSMARQNFELLKSIVTL